jgi:DNA topoisomerase I
MAFLAKLKSPHKGMSREDVRVKPLPAKKKKSEVLADPVESARAAGLRYVSDTRPGLQRKQRHHGFRYIDTNGSVVRDAETLARIKSLVIPPAWSEVWICPHAKGHLQATGRDARGRKQSLYHPHWREVRDETKYERMLLFGVALPTIRKQVEQDLALPGLPRGKVLATLVRLMETTLIRVGNSEYARQNKSYGLTTLREKHVRVDGSTITFNFQGKSGIHHTVDIHDRRLAKIVQRCQDIPGYELFQYFDHEGMHHTVDSADVNAYLQEITNQPFTAKDFRTWAGTVLSCSLLCECEAFESETQAKRNVVQAIKAVAAQLGNTPSICRKCYVHPAVLDCYMGGALIEATTRPMKKKLAMQYRGLKQEEIALVNLLQYQLPRSTA